MPVEKRERFHPAHRAFWQSMMTKGKRGNVKAAIDAAVNAVRVGSVGSLVEVHIVFADETKPSDHGPVLNFVEVETLDGRSVRAGTWLKRDGFDVLALTVHHSDIRS